MAKEAKIPSPRRRDWLNGFPDEPASGASDDLPGLDEFKNGCPNLEQTFGDVRTSIEETLKLLKLPSNLRDLMSIPEVPSSAAECEALRADLRKDGICSEDEIEYYINLQRTKHDETVDAGINAMMWIEHAIGCLKVSDLRRGMSAAFHAGFSCGELRARASYGFVHGSSAQPKRKGVTTRLFGLTENAWRRYHKDPGNAGSQPTAEWLLGDMFPEVQTNFSRDSFVWRNNDNKWKKATIGSFRNSLTRWKKQFTL